MPTATHRPTDNEIESAILTAVTDLARTDADMVSWQRVRAQLPEGWGWRRVHEAQHRLWRRGDLVLVQVRGTPLVGLADECSRIADRATELRGERKHVAMV